MAIQKVGVKAARQADAASRMARVLSVLQQQQTPAVTATYQPKNLDPKSRQDASAPPSNIFSVLHSITTFRESSVREFQEASRQVSTPASECRARSCYAKVVTNAQGLLLVLQRTFTDTLGYLSRGGAADSGGDGDGDGGGGGGDGGGGVRSIRTTVTSFTAQVVIECFHHMQMALALLSTSLPTTTLQLDQSLLDVASVVREQIMQTPLSVAHTRVNAHMPDDESEGSSLSSRDTMMQTAWLCVKHACGCLETVLKSISLDVMRDAVQSTHLKTNTADPAAHGLSSPPSSNPPPPPISTSNPDTTIPKPHSEAQTQTKLKLRSKELPSLITSVRSKSAIPAVQARSSDTSSALSFLVSVGEVLFAVLLRSQHTGVLQVTRDAFDATLRRICFVRKCHAKGSPQTNGKCTRCNYACDIFIRINFCISSFI